MTTRNKLSELALYVAERSRDQAKFGAIKLNKALFYADLRAFEETGETITGAAYVKKQFGPVPSGMSDLIREMEREGRAEIVKTLMPDGHTQCRLVPLRGPDLSNFTASQLAIVDELVHEFRNKSATELSDLTHEWSGWVAARMDEEIPWSAAHVQRPRELHFHELERGRSVAERLGMLGAN